MDKKWMGRAIADPKDHDELERIAARKQFHFGLPREQADEEAYKTYRRRAHCQAAAHHLSRMKDAISSGEKEVADKHRAMYEAHVAKLGLKSGDTPPAEVTQHMPTKGFNEVKSFSNHGADKLIVGK